MEYILKNEGTLLHQICRNNCIKDVEKTLDFVINTLEYDINEEYDFLRYTPLMLCAMYQKNTKMIKTLIQQYNVNIDKLNKNDKSAFDLAKIYNKSHARQEIIKLLKQ
eukprot:311660_1